MNDDIKDFDDDDDDNDNDYDEQKDVQMLVLICHYCCTFNVYTQFVLLFYGQSSSRPRSNHSCSTE